MVTVDEGALTVTIVDQMGGADSSVTHCYTSLI
jgi:hypothetical protein